MLKNEYKISLEFLNKNKSETESLSEKINIKTGALKSLLNKENKHFYFPSSFHFGISSRILPIHFSVWGKMRKIWSETFLFSFALDL